VNLIKEFRMNAETITPFLFIGMLIASVISIGWPRYRADPMEDQTPPRQHDQQSQYTGPAINLHVRDEQWLEGYKAYIADNAAPNSLADAMVLQAVRDIVNNEGLSKAAQYHMLDALQMQVWNAHPRGMAADVIETINDEMEAIEHPDWHGRFGTFKSVRR
jgi:hypothetical protein